ncbi:MAG: carbonic anhydrase [Candidatus Obscuribacterales bacterium]|nr:carbonic anhydrase [Candidatus Obscuribacterales bacterium]
MKKSSLLMASLLLVTGLNQTTAEAASEKSTAPSPAEALTELKRGNGRYLEGVSKHPRIDPARRLKTAKKGQKPIASILSCADARVPVEMIFDKGFGDLFVVRVAGNVCDTAELASLEFGSLYLNTPLIVVLGHSKCGAVQAAVDETELKGSLPLLIKEISPAVKAARKAAPEAKGEDLTNKAIEENVRLSIDHIMKSPGIARAVKEKKLLVKGAVRDLKSGKVRWLED